MWKEESRLLKKQIFPICYRGHLPRFHSWEHCQSERGVCCPLCPRYHWCGSYSPGWTQHQLYYALSTSSGPRQFDFVKPWIVAVQVRMSGMAWIKALSRRRGMYLVSFSFTKSSCRSTPSLTSAKVSLMTVQLFRRYSQSWFSNSKTSSGIIFRGMYSRKHESLCASTSLVVTMFGARMVLIAK
jgi:hypothetical protein